LVSSAAAKILCGRTSRYRTLGDVFRFTVFADRALDRAAMTAASALLSSAGPLALDGDRR
jgi:hypothetical protein